MDINTIITHLKNFSDTWNGWNGVITGLYRFNPLNLGANDKQNLDKDFDWGKTISDSWKSVFGTKGANDGAYKPLFPNN